MIKKLQNIRKPYLFYNYLCFRIDYNNNTMIKPQNMQQMYQKNNTMTTIGNGNTNISMIMAAERRTNYNTNNEAIKTGNKRNFDEFNSTNSPNINMKCENGRKRTKTENFNYNNNNNPNFISTAKKEKFVLNSNVKVEAFHDTFQNILGDYPENLRSNIENTLNELKNEGYTVIMLKILFLYI